MERKFGIIAGTAMCELPGLIIDQEGLFDTKFFGMVWMIQGRVAGQQVIIILRHGRYHEHLPQETNFVGNLVAMKMNGVTDVIAVSAMGGLSKGYDPGTIVLVDMTADKTWGRRNTIFGDGIAGHCARPNAVCPRLHAFLLERAQRLGVPHQRCGKLVVINGPRFSSIPESENNRTDSYDVVGMNTEPEAGLARELCMCYVVIGQITDLDNPPHAIMAGVDQPVISGALPRVGKIASRLIVATLEDAHLLPEWEEYMSCKCKNVLQGAILTDPRGVSPIARDRLCHIFGIKEIPSEWFAR